MSAGWDFRRGDKLRNRDTGKIGVALSDPFSDVVLVKQDDGVTTYWPVSKSEPVLPELPKKPNQDEAS